MADRSSQDEVTRYRRVVLKLSGESFAHAGERGISMDEVVAICARCARRYKAAFRSRLSSAAATFCVALEFTAGISSIQEATGHYMGMLATVINGLALQDAIESLGRETRLLTAIRMDGVPAADERRGHRLAPSRADPGCPSRRRGAGSSHRARMVRTADRRPPRRAWAWPRVSGSFWGLGDVAVLDGRTGLSGPRLIRPAPGSSG